MTKAAQKALPTTYLIRKEREIEKYVGYQKAAAYLADEKFSICNCEGFARNAHCKHLDLKNLLVEFKVDEMVFYGKELGECKPKNSEQIQKLATKLVEVLKSHFFFERIELHELVKTPVSPDLYGCIKFKGYRNKKTLVVGYAQGVMFVVRPVETDAA